MVELLLLAQESQVERLSDALVMELDALSVSVEDADADTPAEDALFGEPGLPAPKEGWQRSRLAALFADDSAATTAAALLLSQEWAGGVQVQAIRPVAEQDWVRLTQAQFAPVEITPDFWIVPSWHAAPAAATKVLRLDPGLAFGTGTHPTTRMCLRWIAEHADALHGSRVLDYGCGSGILAIGAALFGAGAIDAVDIDPAAVQSTRDNAQANGVPCINAGPPELAGAACGAYPLVLANILATPLKLLAPLLSAHVAPGGRLVLAGILERQAQELQKAYAPRLSLKVAASDDGWILMTARRAAFGRD
ncbi:50S ribosomal protein L11 methyltransferase [Methylibium sp.]|uniref:50S ribosomal protein L11 methyltransferase n=1 Tax=Methylibium sp. TaxID=2067992 RepID=UPI00185A2624|nr:50S ribosomal protein L11 methyltransferase [Methylibium sp.]MBA3590570.1 50S ribosomal protein L11 methyltransferase [Methylibium sp.]